MRHRSELWQAQKQTLLTGLLAGVFMLTLFIVAGKPTFGAEPPPVPQGQENAPGMKAEPGMPGEAKKEDCNGPPVVCVGVNVSQLPYPGCTSGQRCTVDTTGKPCGLALSGKKCQTVNMSGVCACQCIK